MKLSVVSLGAALLAAVACSAGSGGGTSDLTIAGGKETDGYKGVIRFLTDAKVTGRFCTGVVVSDSTALIAGHCVMSLASDAYIYAERPNESTDPIKSDKVYLWLSIGGASRLDDKTIARDLAVVSFPGDPFKNYEKVKLSESVIAGTSTQSGEVTLVGYGSNELGNTNGARDSLGVKRVGKNSIFKADGGFYQIRSEIAKIGSEDHAIAASGDAGAPLFDALGNLIGIGAGILLKDKDNNPTKVIKDSFGYEIYDVQNAVYAYNAFVDLSSEASLKLMRYAVWQGKGRVVIPGISVDKEVKLSSEDEIHTQLSKNAPNGEWLSMVGGGGIFRQSTALALQSFSGASCSGSPGQTYQNNSPGFASAGAVCGGGAPGQPSSPFTYNPTQGTSAVSYGPASGPMAYPSVFGPPPPVNQFPSNAYNTNAQVRVGAPGMASASSYQSGQFGNTVSWPGGSMYQGPGGQTIMFGGPGNFMSQGPNGQTMSF